jgi:Carboxypeptidase regulatory-like domain
LETNLSKNKCEAPTKSLILMLIIGLIASFYLSAFAQQIQINGKVVDEKGQPMELANVIIIDSKGTVVKYGSSAKDGSFQLLFNTKSINTEYVIEVSFVGYQKQKIAIQPALELYTFRMLPDAAMLKDIFVKNRPILQRLGDTLRYEVMSFARAEDRSIGDVLRRMPGINIADDGTIFFNGKKIENLYIHGDDLMDGKYAIAPKVIRKEDIASVDVIRNHQPIKVLKDKVLTDNTAINLVLKNENDIKVSTQVATGAGIPRQYDLSVTPILLNKHFKILSTVASNNSSVDYAGNFKQLGSSNFTSDISTQHPAYSLSLGTIGNPDLTPSRYYRNTSGMGILNANYNDSDGLQYKINAQLLLDRNKFDYDSRVESYLSKDTVIYRERQALANKPMLLNLAFNLMSNKEHGFFNNALRLNVKQDMDRSRLDFNAQGFDQSLQKKQVELSNDLNWIPAIGNKAIAELRWLLKYGANKQNLLLGEGYKSEIPGQQGTYDQVRQDVDMPALLSHAYFSYKLPNRNITQDYRVGYINEIQRFDSSLEFSQNGVRMLYNGDPGNQLRWNRQQAYLFSEYQLKTDKVQATLQIPLAYQLIAYKDINFNLDQDIHRPLITPNFRIQYNFSVEQRLLVSYRFNRDFGDINSVYRGAVLRNYRTLQTNNADIQEKQIHSASLGYEYEKSVSMLFLNGSLSYDRIQANTIITSILTDSIQTSVVLPFANIYSTARLNLGFSKYIFGLKSTAGLKMQLSRFVFQQIINNQLTPSQSHTASLTGTLQKRLFSALSFNYQPVVTWTSSKVKAGGDLIASTSFNTFRADQSLRLALNHKNNTLEINAQHSYTNQQSNGSRAYFFADANYRRHLKKLNTDISLNITNLFDVKDYRLYSSLTNQLLVNQYILVGRMIVLRAEWYF